MEFTGFSIEGPLLIKPKVFSDERGYFFESYNNIHFEKAGLIANFVQDNQSQSHRFVLRGLHFQKPPFEQGKLVRVVKGKVLDIAVDIRKSSPTYGKHLSVELSDENNFMLWVPPGFAHGFITLEHDTVFVYKCSNVYNQESEGGILWNDPDLNINWQHPLPLISEKDLMLPLLSEIENPF